MNTNTVHLLCVIPTLGHGGAQKILASLTRSFSEDPNKYGISGISLLTFKNNQDNFYDVDSRVELHSLNTIEGSAASFPSLIRSSWRLRQYLKTHNPDIILSFQDIANFAVVIGSYGTKRRVIVSERQDTRFYFLASIRKHVRNILYSFTDDIVVQTTVIKNQFPYRLKKKISVIPNHIECCHLKAKPDLPGDDGYFRAISVGRLVDQKNFKLLIDAACFLKQYQTQWKIDIYGAGALLDSLQELILANELGNFITINPPTTGILEIMGKSNLFLFPSKYEGFPNVLAEAVSCGLPSIAYGDVSGSTDLIKHDFNGLLLTENERNPICFARSIGYLFGKPNLRKSFGRNCADILAKYKEEQLLNDWRELLVDKSLYR